MNLTPTPVTPDQWQKVVKALAYSFGSGFTGGLILAITGVFTSIAQGGHVAVGSSLVMALIVGGVVGGLNALAVTVKQVFTPAN